MGWGGTTFPASLHFHSSLSFSVACGSCLGSLTAASQRERDLHKSSGIKGDPAAGRLQFKPAHKPLNNQYGKGKRQKIEGINHWLWQTGPNKNGINKQSSNPSGETDRLVFTTRRSININCVCSPITLLGCVIFPVTPPSDSQTSVDFILTVKI